MDVEQINQYKKELEDLRATYNSILGRNGELDKQLAAANGNILRGNELYAKKVTEVDSLNRRVPDQVALSNNLQKQVADSLQRVPTADKTVVT